MPFIPLVPAPSVTINASSNQTVGKSLTLESSITTVRGITSRVDIVWSSNGVELRGIMGATANSTNDNGEVYEYTYDIPLLSTSDDGRIIECEIIIMTTPSIVAISNVTLDVTGKYVVIHKYSTIQVKLYKCMWLHTCIYTFYMYKSS